MKAILILIPLLVTTLSLAGDRPCKDKGDAQRAARVAVRDCLDSWGKAKDAAPGEDCSAKVGAFIQAAKDRMACQAEHKKK